MTINNDYKFIKRCFELAREGEGYVSPNPLVGAAIVKNDKIISEGYHKKYGGAHAEAAAISSANQNLFGATLYCNLEPCCHTNKQTPPCVPQIISSGIKRVVLSNLDPNPSVNGKGIQQLKDAGIEILQDILSDEGEELNRFYFKSVRTNLPYVTIKIAQSKDGMINSNKAERTRITCNESEIFVHHQRSRYDAVLVGANTINIDNPKLNVRRVKGRNPLRIVIGGNLNLNSKADVFNDELKNLTWLFTSANSDISKKELFRKKGVKVFEIESDMKLRLDLKSVLIQLHKNKITSVFVEGGAQIFNQFIEQKLFDELVILEAPILIREGIKPFPEWMSRFVGSPSEDSRGFLLRQVLQLKSVEKLGVDEKRVYRKIEQYEKTK